MHVCFFCNYLFYSLFLYLINCFLIYLSPDSNVIRSFEDLLHYFKIPPKTLLSAANENTLLDTVSGVRYQLAENIKRGDFIGYGLVNANLNMEKNLNFPTLESCKNKLTNLKKIKSLKKHYKKEILFHL